MTVNYDPVGSGGGREGFISGGFDFAGSDSYLDNEEGELDKAVKRCGEEPIEVPAYVSPIAVVYNLEGVDELNLSPETLAGIFAGEITEWDDEAIAEDNPDAELPSETINPVHRSDESGTTGNFTNYLSQVAGEVWTAGEIEIWPKEYGGEGGNGTSGVVSAVESSVNSIGYADASQAGELGVANIGVGEEFVAPEPEAAAKIFEVSQRVEDAADTQMVYDLDYATEEAGVYPIVLDLLPDGVPLLRGRRPGGPDQGLPLLHPQRGGSADLGGERRIGPLTDSVRTEAEEIIGQISAG